MSARSNFLGASAVVAAVASLCAAGLAGAQTVERTVVVANGLMRVLEDASPAQGGAAKVPAAATPASDAVNRGGFMVRVLREPGQTAAPGNARLAVVADLTSATPSAALVTQVGANGARALTLATEPAVQAPAARTPALTIVEFADDAELQRVMQNPKPNVLYRRATPGVSAKP